MTVQVIECHLLLPALTFLQGHRDKMTPKNRLFAGLALCQLIYEQYLNVPENEIQNLVMLLTMDVNTEQRSCPQVAALRDFSSDEQK